MSSVYAPVLSKNRLRSKQPARTICPGEPLISLARRNFTRRRPPSVLRFTPFPFSPSYFLLSNFLSFLEIAVNATGCLPSVNCLLIRQRTDSPWQTSDLGFSERDGGPERQSRGRVSSHLGITPVNERRDTPRRGASSRVGKNRRLILFILFLPSDSSAATSGQRESGESLKAWD